MDVAAAQRDPHLFRIGKLRHCFSEVDGGEALARAVNNLAIRIQETGALVTCDPLPTVFANRAQLVQLFQNLIGNSLKFRRTPEPRIRVSAKRRDGHWVFAVSDDGIGFDMKYADRIFAVFQRLHRREDYPGTGMGLAICKRIVERHGGEIWVESQPGEGSTFFFTLPNCLPLVENAANDRPAPTMAADLADGGPTPSLN